jgi:adenylyl-sulfate kinase
MTKSTNIKWQEGLVTRQERIEHLGCRGCTVWLTGLPASGKTTLASNLELALTRRGQHVYRLDGDNIRHGLNKNLGFSPEDRNENIRRISEVARLFADSGCVAVTAFISPYAADRDEARRLHEQAELAFFEVFVDAPVEVCAQRDPKGHYQKAKEGLMKGFTGVDAPYELPPNPAMVLKTAERSVDECVAELISLLERHQVIKPV